MTPNPQAEQVAAIVAEMRDELEHSHYTVEVTVEAFKAWADRLEALMERQVQPVAWQERYRQGGHWGSWRPTSESYFKHYESCCARNGISPPDWEVRALYALPPPPKEGESR